MKKSLLALAVLGAFAGAAQAQSSVTIYGIVDTGVAYTSKVGYTDVNGNAATGSKFGLNSGVVSGSRIGFKGVEDLGGGLSAVFNLETGFTNDDGGLQGSDGVTKTGNLFRRKSVVGLAGGFGTVLLGRQTDLADQLGGYASVADFGGVTQYSGSALSRLQGTRTNNSIRFDTNTISGFTGSLIYGFGEQAGKTSAGQSFGIGAKYDNGPLGLGINYYQSKAGTTPSDTSLTGTSSTLTVPAQISAAANAGSTAAKVVNVLASYQFGPARVYANWSRVKQDLNTANVTALTAANRLTNATLGNSNKADMYEIGTAYSLSPSLKLLAAVDHTRASYDGLTTKAKLTQISLGADYNLSKRTDVYAFLANMRTSDMANPGITGSGTGSDASQNAALVGVRHKF